MREALAGTASSFAAGCSPEANDAKNSGAGFQPSVDTGFQPKEHSGVEQAARIKERNRLAEQRRMLIPEVKERRRLTDKRRRARPEVKERIRRARQRSYTTATPESKEMARLRKKGTWRHQKAKRRLA